MWVIRAVEAREEREREKMSEKVEVVVVVGGGSSQPQWMNRKETRFGERPQWGLAALGDNT